MTRSCRFCKQAFEITDGDLAFYDKVSPVFNGRKEVIPLPMLCPDCRRRRRFSFRNESKLYNDHCDLCGKDMISVYSPDKPFRVYCQACWWSDAWDPFLFGRPLDPERSFSEQLREVQAQVPRLALMNTEAENAEYCNFSRVNKNSYLLVGCSYNENCLYSSRSLYCESTVDCLSCIKCEQCYQGVDSENCYGCAYFQNCSTTRDSLLCMNLRGCADCILCSNLQNKQYCFRNQQLTKEEYAKVKEEVLRNFPKAYEAYISMMKGMVVKDLNMTFSENCVGDRLFHSSKSRDCYDASKLEDCRFVTSAAECRDSVDLDYADKSELCYEVTNSSNNYHHLFNHTAWFDHDILYSNLCFHSNDLFGCIGMRKNSYCILNRQYTKEEYEALVPKIIDRMRKAPGSGPGQAPEWGEFFDPSLSPFGYNETVAMEYYPLEKEEALRLGFNWSDYVAPPPKVDRIVKASQLPDSIQDVPDSILDWAVECEVSGRSFRIIKQELKFLREHGLPLPRRHPDQRHLDRMKLRNPRKLFDRTCMQCSKLIQTTYAPDRPEKVYCEECYLGEVY